ncbi:MAG: PH domain-containing protein [Muribaculaceae bacterium]|nr:PH domain-containing protein [Muribaculaceae bacterium]
MKIKKIIAPGETIIYEPKLSKWAYLHLGRLIRNLTTTIFVSNKRFFHSHGWINRHAHEIVIGKVESILVEQTFWGRLCNYGTVKVSGTGAGTIILRYIKRPFEFQRQLRAAQGADASSATTPPLNS